MVIRRRLGWTAPHAPRHLLAVLSAVALLASACSGSDQGLRAGDAATVADGFRAEYAVDGGEWTTAGAGQAVPEGAQVRPADGELRLVFRDGTARLSSDAQATLTAQRVTVERGEALISSSGELDAAVSDTAVAGSGTYRLSSGLSARVGVYEGAVTVTRPAQERDVQALRELDLSAFRLATPDPLRYRESDPWDRDLLAPAIAFDGEAARLVRGMDVELGRRPLKASFYRQFTQPAVVGLLADEARVSRGAAFGPPSDVLLTLFIAQAAAGDAVAPAVRRVTDLRDDGARWGLIAVELDVPSAQVVASIDQLGDSQIAAAERAAVAPRRSDDAPGEPEVAAAGDATAALAGSTEAGSSGTTASSTDSDTTDVTTTTDDGGTSTGDGGTDTGDGGTGTGDDGGGEPTVEQELEQVVTDVVGQTPDPGDGEALPAGLPSPDDLPL